MASLGRFERPTNCLEGSRSVQLSYRDGSTIHQKFSMSWKARSTLAQVALIGIHGILANR